MAKKKIIKKSTKPEGRPTKYKPEYCQEIINFISQNPTRHSLLSFSIHIDVHTDTLHEWRKVHPEFSVAMHKAINIRREALEQVGTDFFTGKNKNGNAQVYQFLMKNWFRNHYTERTEVKQQVTATVETNVNDELREIIATLREIPTSSKT